MKVVIIFTGLIAHLTSGPTWRAIAVEADCHKVILTTRADALVDKCTAPCVEDPKGTVTIPLGNEAFKLEGVKNPIFPTKSAGFESTVPSLMTVLQAPIDPEVEAGDITHDGVAASFDLVGGEVSTQLCLSDAAGWSGHGDQLPTCLASQTVWTGDVTDELTLRGTTHTWKFKPGSRLEISNQLPGHHFKLYQKLSRKSSNVRVPSPSNAKICTLCTPMERKGRALDHPDLECTPTRYP